MTIVKRYGYRFVAVWFLLALVVSVGMDLPTSGPAAAQGGGGETSQGWYSDVLGTCRSVLNLPSWLLGSGSGAWAFGIGGAAAYTTPQAAGTGAAVATATSGSAATVTGTVALGAAEGLAVAAVGAGAFCGTVVGLENVWGSADEAWFVENSPEMPEGVSSSGMVDCLSVGEAAVEGSQCLRVTWDALPYLGSGVVPNKAYIYTYPTASSAYSGTAYSRVGLTGLCSWFNASGMTANPLCLSSAGPTSTPPTYGPGSVTYRFYCGDSPTCYLTDKSYVQILYDPPGTGSNVYFLTGPIDEALQAKGAHRKGHASLLCKQPSTGSVVGVNDDVEYWTSDGLPDGFGDLACPSGYAPIGKNVSTLEDHGTEYASQWYPELTWSAPESVVNNATTLACFLPRATPCPIWESAPDSVNVNVGGEAGVAVPRTALASTVGTLLDTAFAAAEPDYDISPEPEPEPTTTTTVPGSSTTVATPTTTTPAQACETGAAGCPNPDPEDGEGSECWPSGWGWFNPAEWVLRPIKCALLWAFWDPSVMADFQSLMNDNGVTSLVMESSVTTSATAGPCIDFEDWTSVCTSAVTDVEMPSGVTGLLVAVVLLFGVFEVVGLFSRVTA